MAAITFHEDTSDDQLRDLLTDERLNMLGAAAFAAGDHVMALRCDHALTDPLARRDVAKEIVKMHTGTGQY